MTVAEAVDLIRPGVPATAGVWADLGAGSGLFSRALARLLGGGTVYALDRDSRALEALRGLARAHVAAEAAIVPVAGDLMHLDAVRELARVELDGALLANALHFAPDPAPVLEAVAHLLKRDARVVVVEYAERQPSRWVPHPVSVQRLATAAREASLGPPRVVARRPSLYGGSMYCAVLEPLPAASNDRPG